MERKKYPFPVGYTGDKVPYIVISDIQKKLAVRDWKQFEIYRRSFISLTVNGEPVVCKWEMDRFIKENNITEDYDKETR